MPCFLMDLRFATGRQQKIRTFRFFFLAQHFHCMFARRVSACASARDEVGSVASGMCASARDEVGSVASGMCASARGDVGSVASRMCESAREETGSVASHMCASAIERY